MDVLRCELCGLEHVTGAVRCDGCDHMLGQQLDLTAMRAELRRTRLRVGFFGALTIATVVGSFALFQGAGFIFFTAPLAIAIHGGWRWLSLSKYLANARRSQ